MLLNNILPLNSPSTRKLLGCKCLILLVCCSILPFSLHAAEFELEAALLAYEAGDFDTAFTQYTELANQGNVEAQVRLASMRGCGGKCC